jgi:nicotinamide-nucleotide amidase
MKLQPSMLKNRAVGVLDACRNKKLRLVTAESCTGGLIAATLTEIAGASDVLERGYVTYSNESKTEMLKVPAKLIAKVGAVSEEVARAMVKGALARSDADIAIAVTGIAGPGGGSPAKPVGLVHLACALRDGPVLHIRHVFPGDRSAIRMATVDVAFALILKQTV